MKIKLPNAKEWSGAENCAVNLRTVRSAGVQMCEPVGMPVVRLDDAGAATFLLDDDHVLSTNDDRHEVYVDGEFAGALPDALINVMPLGLPGEAVLFTAEGTHWISGNRLQPPLSECGADVSVNVGADLLPIQADVLFDDLRGSYPRLSESIDDDDSVKITAAFNETLHALIDRASAKGIFTQPVQMAWRIVDNNGRVVARGTPHTVGTIQGNQTIIFRMAKTDNGRLALAAPSAMELVPWAARVIVHRVESDFWRNKAHTLEVLAWPMEVSVQKRGYLLTTNSYGDILLYAYVDVTSTVVPGSSPKVVARIEHPLEGLEQLITADFGGDDVDWSPWAESILKPTVVYRGGSITAYAEASQPGMLMLAFGGNPLEIKGVHKICGGNILHLCAPVGGGGGWNYGRLHLLAFATDGIFSVSVDSQLRSASSTLVNTFGVKRPDAVVATPEAVYVANEIGQLIRIVGSRSHMVPFPSEVNALAWNGDRAELWAINSMGAPFVMDSDGGVSLRSDVAVERVVGQHMVVDVFNALRTLRVEEPQEVNVSWTCRCEDRFRKRVRTARWVFDAHHVDCLMLRLWADNGGASQRLLELRVDGTVNAPVSARVVCPTRAYYTAQIFGRVTPPARFNALNIE